MSIPEALPIVSYFGGAAKAHHLLVDFRRLTMASGLLAVMMSAACTSESEPSSPPAPSPAPPLVIRTFRGLPPGSHIHPTFGTIGPAPVLLFASRTTLDFAMYGSGSCPYLPTALTVRDPSHVDLSAQSDFGRSTRACTADLSPTTSQVRIDPSVVDVAAPVHVKVTINNPRAVPRSVDVLVQPLRK